MMILQMMMIMMPIKFVGVVGERRLKMAVKGMSVMKRAMKREMMQTWLEMVRECKEMMQTWVEMARESKEMAREKYVEWVSLAR